MMAPPHTLRWVRVEQDERGVATVSMNKPPVNALGGELVDDLTAAASALSEDQAVRCVVLRSAGKHFCAGADLKERRSMTVEQVRAFVPRLAGAVNRFAALPVPVIAAVRGAAAGGGCELALGCDLRIFSEDAKVGLRETALAIIPGAGGTQRLPRMVGVATAKRWIFTAGMFTAAEAWADGVADQVVPADKLDTAADDLAGAIAANGPVAVRLAKQAIERGADLPLKEALELEWEAYQGVLETKDREEALKAFSDKRLPRFRGC
jgi:enoyl-CoA hydratase/carnithine racemase